MVDSHLGNPGRVAATPLPLALVVSAGCYLLLLFVGNSLLNDGDTYLHIALGDWMIAHHAVPHVDTFSATMAGKPWISSEWLAQVLFAEAYSLAGWSGVVMLSAAAIASALGLLTRYLLDKLPIGPALVLSAGAFVLASPHMLARPHALALPVMVAWIAGLMRALDGRQAPPFALLPLMTLWANLHGGFTFGIFFIAPMALEAVWAAEPSKRFRIGMDWCGFALAAIVAACITPYGPESILVTLRILGLGEALGLIGEWQPQSFSKLNAFVVCLWLGIGFTFYRGLTLPPIRILVLLGLVYMAFEHARNSELLGLVAPLVIAAPLASHLGRPEAESFDWRGTLGIGPLGLILALGGMSLAMAHLINYRPSPLVTPTRAVATIKATGKTHIFNSYDFGDYLIAAGLAPFIDGRTELYGEAFFMRHHRAENLYDMNAFLEVLHDNHIDVTLLRPGTPAVGLLDRLKNWKRLYGDDFAVVHERTGPPSQELDQLQ